MTQRPFNRNSVDDLLTVVSSRGLHLNNLFQYPLPESDQWRWQANLTDGQRYWDFGRGGSAAEALRDALFKSSTTTPTGPIGPVPGSKVPKPRADIEGFEI